MGEAGNTSSLKYTKIYFPSKGVRYIIVNDNVDIKIYEDWSVEHITEGNFNMLSERYQEEQTKLDALLLNTLIEKIVIHEGKKGADGVREQEGEREICLK